MLSKDIEISNMETGQNTFYHVEQYQKVFTTKVFTLQFKTFDR